MESRYGWWIGRRRDCWSRTSGRAGVRFRSFSEPKKVMAHLTLFSSRAYSSKNNTRQISCVSSIFENDSVSLTKRPGRWRNVLFQCSTWLVCPLFLPTFSCQPLGGSNFRARLSCNSTRSRCGVSLVGSFRECSPIASGMSPRRDCRWCKLLSGWCGGIGLSRSTVCSGTDTRMTKAHLAPGLSFLGGRRAHGDTFLVGAQDHILAGWTLSGAGGVLNETTPAVAAAVALLQ